MESTSKYLGQSFEWYVVIRYWLQNLYNKVYNNPKQKWHGSYNYELYNHETNKRLTISGNQLRLLASGKRTISQMLSTKAKGSKNPQINAYLKWLRNK